VIYVLPEADHTTLAAFDAQANELRDLDGKGVLDPCVDKWVRHNPVNRARAKNVCLRIPSSSSIDDGGVNGTMYLRQWQRLDILYTLSVYFLSGVHSGCLVRKHARSRSMDKNPLLARRVKFLLQTFQHGTGTSQVINISGVNNVIRLL